MPLVSKTFSQIITFTRASSATYFDAAGVLQTATTDVPRFDYNPSTLAALGFLIEGSRTNIVLRSQDFSTGWLVSQSTLTAASGMAPDGTNTAGKLVLNSGVTVTSSRSAYQDFAGITGIQTISIFAKAVEFNVLRISARAADNTTLNGPDFTLSGAGSFGALGDATSASITPVGNGWYRCAATFDVLTGATDVRPYYASSQATGDGTSGILIWGAQLEAGAFPTSYIPTTTAAVTRAADVASVNTLSPWYNAAEGTLYAESSGFATNSRIVSFSDNSSSNRIHIARGTGSGGNINATVTVSGAVQVNALILGSSLASGVLTKAAFTYKQDDFAGVVNGGTVVTDTTGTIPTVTQLTLGNGDALGANVFNGYLRRITYYPRRLSNAELQSITT